MEKELVSVIIPVYNGEKYIEKCLQSVQKQTYQEIEILIINDGSTDKTKEILEKIANKEKIACILQEKENKGTAVCKNKAIKHSKGKYIFFVDSDDTIKKDAIEQMLHELKKNEADSIRTTYVFDYDGKIRKGNEQIENAIFTQDTKKELLQKLLVDEIHGFCSGVFLFKKDIMIKNNITFKEDMTIMEDFIFLVEILKNSNIVVTSNLVTLNYYQNNEGLTKSYQNIEKRWYNIEVRLQYTLTLVQQYKSLEKYQEEMIRYLIMMYIKSTKYIFLQKISKQDAQEKLKQLKKIVNSRIEQYEIDKSKFNLIGKVIYYLLNKESINILHTMFRLLNTIKK